MIKGNLEFTHNYSGDRGDFPIAVAGLLPGYRGPAYALQRFADGEISIINERPFVSKNCGWSYPGGPSEMSRRLRLAFEDSSPGMHTGISCLCHEPPEHGEWSIQNIKLPHSRVTFASLFIWGNYERFVREVFERSPAVIVASRGQRKSLRKPDYFVPVDGVNTEWQRFLDELPKLVDELLTVDRPIMVSAGPLANLIITEYWARAENPQVIVDVGSAVDVQVKGRSTRRYHNASSDKRLWKCTWTFGEAKPAEPSPPLPLPPPPPRLNRQERIAARQARIEARSTRRAAKAERRERRERRALASAGASSTLSSVAL